MKSAIKIIAKYGHPLWKGLEKTLISNNGEGDFPAPVFIVGAPRSGSTILYQILTNYLKVNYADNLCQAFYRDMGLGMALSLHIFKDRAHNCYTSRFGDTEACGWHAPSECGPYFRRYLPADEHYIAQEDMGRYEKNGLKVSLERLFRMSPYPFVIKNLVLSMRLRLIHRFWPRARIIWVRREPENIVHSILRARRQLNIPAHQWWSVKPKRFRQWLSLPEDEMVVQQVMAIEQHIQNDWILFNENQRMEMNYNTFVNRTERHISAVGSFIGQTERRENYIPFRTRIPEKRDNEHIQKLIRRLYP